MAGVLDGLRILEVGGVGPAPFACMMLADHGAEVIRIATPGSPVESAAHAVLHRSRTVLQVDLKRPEGIALLRDLADASDGLVEGFRPGVMERLGLGPELLIERNPRLVYGRMTGWGQDGPLAQVAGHDINYIAVSGTLHAVGTKEKPIPPLNLVGDFGGGGLMLAFGMVSAMLAVQRGGKGQVIDCAMTEGSALLMSMMWGFRGAGMWRDERASNLLDGAAPFYDTYETADGKWIAIAAIEPKFYAALREVLGLGEDSAFDAQYDPRGWAANKEKLAAIFRTRTREAWCDAFEGREACFAPVLSMAEALDHPHNRARGSFIESGGIVQPAPAPRFSDTPAPAPRATGDAATLLGDLGYDAERIASLTQSGIIG